MKKIKLLSCVLASLLLGACATTAPVENGPIVEDVSPKVPQPTRPQVVVESATISSNPVPKREGLKRIENSSIQSRVPEKRQTINRGNVGAASRPARSPVVQKMLRQAEDASAAGQWSQAENYLERALRVAPRNGQVWQRLAAVKLAQDRPHQAVQFARKAISLASVNNAVAIESWKIVEESNLRLNKPTKAERAKQERLKLSL